jgi:hypothetical protein
MRWHQSQARRANLLKNEKIKMKRQIIAFVMLCSSVVALGMPAPVRAEGKSAIGPSIVFGGGGALFGIDARFGISDNLSLRPLVYFGNGATIFGTSLTYDFDLGRSTKNPVTPFLGGGILIGSGGGGSATAAFFTGGADFAVSDSIDLKAALVVPFSSGGSATLISLGAGFKF